MEYQHLEHGDECPICKNGTVEVLVSFGEVRCAGECGTIWTDDENVFACCSECHNLFNPEEMGDEDMCQTCEDWIVTE